MQASGPQSVTIEDSFSMSTDRSASVRPRRERLLSELAIVAGIAKETLAPNPKLNWRDWTADYGLVRDLIEETYPTISAT